MKTEIIYGYHPVLEAIRGGRRKVFEIFVPLEKSGDRTADIENRAAGVNVPVSRIALPRLRAMAGTASHQGVCARVGSYEPASLSEILAKAEHDPFLLLLDGIVDPHNLGALIRTAACAGVDGVVTPKDRSAPPTPAVSKASAGALEHMLLARVTNMVATIKKLKQQGVWVVGLDSASREHIYRCDLKGPLALVVGGEEKGIRPLVATNCDRLASIPQRGNVESLNASAAGAVAMYEAMRQRSGY